VKKDTEAAYCSAKVKMEHIYNRTNATNFHSCSY